MGTKAVQEMSAHNRKDLAVVMLSFNSCQHLKRSVQAVIDAATEAKLSLEFFIIDNGSADGSIEILTNFYEQHPDTIKLKLFENNTGTTVSRNWGLSRANSKYILVLDSDTYINSQALTHLIGILKSDQKIGMAAPKVIYPSGNFQKSTDVFPTLRNKFMRFFFLKSEEQKQHVNQPTSPIDVDYAISAFWLFKYELLEKVGLLDEKIFYSPEDVDYCIRIWQAGYKIVYDPNVGIIHDAQEISRKKLNKFFFSHLVGLFYLFRKHKYGIINKTPQLIIRAAL